MAEVAGPAAALDLLAGPDGDPRMAGNHRLDAVRGHLLELAGDRSAARESYLRAARRTTSLPEQRYLTDRATRLQPCSPRSPRFRKATFLNSADLGRASSPCLSSGPARRRTPGGGGTSIGRHLLR